MRSRMIGCIRITQGFTGRDFLQTDASSDVASQNFLDFFAVVGVHLQNTTDTLFLALDRVITGITGIQNARNKRG